MEVSHFFSAKGLRMPVDFIHAIIGLLFLSVWGVISLFALTGNPSSGSHASSSSHHNQSHK